MKTQTLFTTAMLLSSIAIAQLQKGSTFVSGSLKLSRSSTEYLFANKSDAPWKYSLPPDAKDKSRIVEINPSIGYFISNKFCVGVFGTISSSTNRYDQWYYDNNYYGYNTMKVKDKSFTWGAGLFGRHYIAIGEKAFFGLQASVGYKKTKLKYQDIDYRSSMDQYNYFVWDALNGTIKEVNIGLNPSLMLTPGKKIGLEFSLGEIIKYTHQNTEVISREAIGSIYEPYTLTETSTKKSGNLEFGLSSLTPSIGIYYFLAKK